MPEWAATCNVTQHMLQLFGLFDSDNQQKGRLRLWDSKIVEFTSKNKGAYSGERCFFGTHEKNQLMVFFHSDYDTVYLSTRFMGTIEPDGTGSKISGVIGKMKSAIFFLWFMVAAMGIGGIVMLSQHLWQQAILLFALAIIAFFCAKITPKDSIVRLEKLLNLISTLPAETLQPENTDLSSEEAENTAGETE